MSNENINWTDMEELAAKVCGLDPDEAEYREIDQALCDKYEISAEAFEEIVKKLFEMLSFGVSPITSTPFVGFSKDHGWLLKKEVQTAEFISNLIQWITEGENPDKGFVKPITSKGIRIYDLLLVKSEWEVSIKKSEL